MIVTPKKVYWLDAGTTRTLTVIQNLRYTTESTDFIDCELVFEEIPTELLPYTIDSKDPSGIGRDLYRDVVSGVYGEIAPYEAPVEG